MRCSTYLDSILILNRKSLDTRNTRRKFAHLWWTLFHGLLVRIRTILCNQRWAYSPITYINHGPTPISRVYIMLIRTNSISRRNQYPGRGSERNNARSRPRNLPICHLKLMLHWRRLHGARFATLRGRRRFWRRKGVLYSRWWGTFPNRAGK